MEELVLKSVQEIGPHGIGAVVALTLLAFAKLMWQSVNVAYKYMKTKPLTILGNKLLNLMQNEDVWDAKTEDYSFHYEKLICENLAVRPYGKSYIVAINAENVTELLNRHDIKKIKQRGREILKRKTEKLTQKNYANLIGQMDGLLKRYPL